MLVLSRKVGETIVIGGQVLVTVKNVRSKNVSLGITAPADVRVDRSEIHVRKNAVNAPRDEGDLPASIRGEAGAGLLTAIERLVANAQTGDGPEIEFCHDLQDYATNPLPLDMERAVLCIVQECVANACRHSKSKQLLIGLSRDNETLCIEVQDWGIGFDPEKLATTCFGLEAIRRPTELLGGTLTIQSRRGEGACVTVEIPLVRPPHEHRRKRGATARHVRGSDYITSSCWASRRRR